MDVQILILMAGRGSRVQGIGQGLPKPLIPVFGRPLVEIVTKNLLPKKKSAQFFYVCLQEHLDKFPMQDLIKGLGVNSTVIPLTELTSGAAASALKAMPFLDLNRPLIIANSDQIFSESMDNFLDFSLNQKFDGSIMTMKASGNKWSYVTENENHEVTLVKEKVQISELATVGIYFYQKALFYKEAAESMIGKNITTNNEHYLAPSYNELIEEGKKISHFSVGTHAVDVFGLGTEEDIRTFEALAGAKEILRKAIQ